MEKNWFKRWELIISAAMVFAVALGAILELREARFQQFEIEKEERRIRFWEEQLSLYKEASDAAATLATASTLEDAREAREKFWKLYWGKLSIVENSSVERAMVAFGNVLEEIEALQEKGEGYKLSALEQPSLDLAHCARASLLSTWKVVEIGEIRICPFPNSR